MKFVYFLECVAVHLATMEHSVKHVSYNEQEQPFGINEHHVKEVIIEDLIG